MQCLILVLAGILPLVAAGATQPSLASGAGPTCREAAASFALGERYSDRLGRRARRAAGARVVRKIEPGRAYTMEFRSERLNVEVDERGRVRSVRCG